MTQSSEEIVINHLYQSNIITKEEIPLLIGWLPKHPKKIIKLYDTEIDTHNAGCFHSKCDDKGVTIVLIKTDKNCRFGGYTSKSWGSSEGAYIGDSTAFLFSFDTKLKYNVNTPKYAIYCHSTYGPSFGNGHDIHISNYAPQNNSSYVNAIAYPLKSQWELNNGVKNFCAKNWEVYQIVYGE